MIECTCPKGRPLSMPHMTGCPMKDADVTPDNVLVFRNNETNQPVSVPADIVTEADRAYAAWERHLAGVSWTQIAREGLWPNVAACQTEIKRYLAEGRTAISTFQRAEISRRWEDRLELLWSAVIEDAQEGKVPSVQAALAIAKTAMTLAGLDKPSEEDVTVQTVVVPSEEYIASLRAVSGES